MAPGRPWRAPLSWPRYFEGGAGCENGCGRDRAPDDDQHLPRRVTQERDCGRPDLSLAPRTSRAFAGIPVTAPNPIATAGAGLHEDRLAVRGRPERREDRQLEHRGPDPRAEENGDGDERDVREPRHDDREPGDTAGVGQRRPQENEAGQPAHPEGAGGDVEPVERDGEPARRSLGRMAGGSGDEDDGGRRGNDADPPDPDRLSRSGRSTGRSRSQRRAPKTTEIDERAGCGGPPRRHRRADVE